VCCCSDYISDDVVYRLKNGRVEAHWETIIGDSITVSAHCWHRRSQGAMPPKFLANLVILCFERQCPKQNTAASLKSKIWGWLRHLLLVTFCRNIPHGAVVHHGSSVYTKQHRRTSSGNTTKLQPPKICFETAEHWITANFRKTNIYIENPQQGSDNLDLFALKLWWGR